MKDQNVTALLADWQKGDKEALAKLSPIVYDELRRVAASYMRSERGEHTLQTTALVHEVYLRLVGANFDLENRSHFFAVSARMMRRILVDHARSKNSGKRGGGAKHLTFDEAALVGQSSDDLLELDEALGKLAVFDEQLAKAVELRFFGGLT